MASDAPAPSSMPQKRSSSVRAGARPCHRRQVPGATWIGDHVRHDPQPPGGDGAELPACRREIGRARHERDALTLLRRLRASTQGALRRPCPARSPRARRTRCARAARSHRPRRRFAARQRLRRARGRPSGLSSTGASLELPSPASRSSSLARNLTYFSPHRPGTRRDAVRAGARTPLAAISSSPCCTSTCPASPPISNPS